ncbi:MAG: hypothetical protein AB7O62_00335 [Pirellulales bacterium]
MPATIIRSDRSDRSEAVYHTLSDGRVVRVAAHPAVHDRSSADVQILSFRGRDFRVSHRVWNAVQTELFGEFPTAEAALAAVLASDWGADR